MTLYFSRYPLGVSVLFSWEKMWHSKMSSPFCLTVLKCVPYIDSVSWELSSREKLKAEAVINRGRWLCSCLCPFSVQVKLLKEQKECEGIRKAN